jgi:hypothetical protein
MARYFNKNTANYSSIGIGQIGTLLNGAAKISWSMIIKPIDTLSTTGVNENSPFHIKINGLSAGLICSIDANTSVGNGKLRVGARSQSADALQNVNGATTLALNTQYTAGGMIDIGGDTITVYLNGAVDAGPTAVTFGAATWTLATASFDDVIGGQTTAPPTTVAQFGGEISEFAIWTDDITAAGFAALHKGLSPLMVMPDKLIAYWPLVGRVSPEPEYINTKSATLTGTIAQAAHPRVIRPHRRVSRRLVTAAAAGVLFNPISGRRAQPVWAGA